MSWPTKNPEAKNPEVVALATKALQILEAALSPLYTKIVIEKQPPVYDELKTLGYLMGVLKDVSYNLDAESSLTKMSDKELIKVAKQFLKKQHVAKESDLTTEE